MNRQADTLEENLDSYQKIARCAREHNSRETSDRTPWLRFAAAAGASLSAATSAEAAINWVMPPQPIRVEIPFDDFSNFTYVDLDGDNQDDLDLAARVETASLTFPLGYRYLGLARGIGTSPNRLMFLGDGQAAGHIRQLAPNFPIPAVTPASIGTIVRVSATTDRHYGSTQGNWDFSDSGLAGFVFGPSGSRRAGWIKINTESAILGGVKRTIAFEISEWAYESVPGISIQAGQTSSVAIPGDYNGNGSVGPEDYTKWKTDFGLAVVAGTGADGNENAKVDAADYTVWRDNLGASGSASLSGAVPEPSAISLGMLALGAAGVIALRRR